MDGNQLIVCSKNNNTPNLIFIGLPLYHHFLGFSQDIKKAPEESGATTIMKTITALGIATRFILVLPKQRL